MKLLGSIRLWNENSSQESVVCVYTSRSVVSDSVTPQTVACQAPLCSLNSPGKNTGVGCHSLRQGIFPNQGLNPGLPDCRWIFYCLSYQGTQILVTATSGYSSSIPENPRVLHLCLQILTLYLLLATTHLFSVPMLLPFSECLINGTRQ